LCFVEFKGSLDKVISRRVHFTIRYKYKGLSDHSALHKLLKYTYNYLSLLSFLDYCFSGTKLSRLKLAHLMGQYLPLISSLQKSKFKNTVMASKKVNLKSAFAKPIGSEFSLQSLSIAKILDNKCFKHRPSYLMFFLFIFSWRRNILVVCSRTREQHRWCGRNYFESIKTVTKMTSLV